jgi:serine/threonine-protein kinase
VAAQLAFASTVLASGPADQAAATTLFQEAKQLAGAGDFARACPKFAEAQRLFPTTGTLLNIGNCYEKLGKLASAWGAFKEAEAAAHRQEDRDREQEAARRAQALAPQLARLTVDVPPAARVPGFELRRDGSVVGEGQWGTALPVDPGEHTFEASAPARKAWSASVKVEANGSSARVEVPALEALPGQRVSEEPPPFWGPQRVAGVVLGGVGIAGLVTSVIFTARLVSKNGASRDHCEPADATQCDPTGVGLRNEAFAAARVATGTFVAGAVAAGAGLVVFLTAPRGAVRPEAPSARWRVVPSAGREYVGLAIQGDW